MIGQFLEDEVQLKLAKLDEQKSPVLNYSDCETTDPNLILACENETCLIECPPNFEMLGNTVLYCDRTGETPIWNATAPLCVKKCNEETDIMLAIDEIQTERQASYIRQFVRKLIERFPIEEKRTRVILLRLLMKIFS